MQMKTQLQNRLHHESLKLNCTTVGNMDHCLLSDALYWSQWYKIASPPQTVEKYNPLFNIYNITCRFVNSFTDHSNGDGTF